MPNGGPSEPRGRLFFEALGKESQRIREGDGCLGGVPADVGSPLRNQFPVLKPILDCIKGRVRLAL